MSISQADYSRLRAARDAVSGIPGIGKAEIAEGGIILTLPPVQRHEQAAEQITEQINFQLPRTHPGYVARRDVTLECLGPHRLVSPDVLVFPGHIRPEIPSHAVLLVVEVVPAPNPQRTYRDRYRDYSAMGIPLYLIVDPRTGTGVVHSEPGYESREKFAFGDKIAVGPWTLDTSGLLTYA
ncbi:Uma2 family endonuclease [Kitasatospora sp. NPDC096077]|uniref:Uma2 family endonuclease n=1 Tax=Kitasatospora sp. NPDC096077 TaxID=3155544 RepID=UPI00332E7D68